MKTGLFVVVDKETKEIWCKADDYKYSKDFQSKAGYKLAEKRFNHDNQPINRIKSS